MKAQQPDHEKRLKETILAHRVPFEEQGWDAMDALLDGDAGKNAPAEMPAPQETPSRPVKRRRFFILLFLLSAVAVFSAKLGLNMLDKRTPDTTTTSSTSHRSSGPGDGNQPVLVPTETSDIETSTISAASIENTPKTVQKTNTTIKTGRGDARTTAGKRASNPDRRWVVQPATAIPVAPHYVSNQKSKSSGNVSAGNTDPNAPAMSTNTDDEKNAGKRDADSLQSEQHESRLDNLAYLPLLPLDSLNYTRDLPEGANVPVKYKERRKWQHGWLLGGNLTVIDYQTGRMNLMPVVGYHVATPWLGGNLETGIQIKAITGYDQAADFEYDIPGSSQQIYLEFKSLVLVESPVVYKKAFSSHSRHYWLAGVRPALVFPVLNYGSYYSGGSGLFTPSTEIELRDGVRWFDLGLTAGWQWRFDDRWALDLRYTQGLFDLTHDNFFGNTDYVLNSDLQLTIRYHVSFYKKH